MYDIHFGRGDRHDIFHLAIEAFVNWLPGQSEPTIEYDEHELTLTDACNLVRNCFDIVPGQYVGDLLGVLDMKSRTYAAIAHAMRASL